ncbi:MAG: ABC transporter permease [candidate division KSB1 bacterium]|nr:ABC transporter permease [candidate division KSB1 bacterium]
MDINNVLLITWKEILNARRNRWFILYTIVFALLSLALSWLGLAGVGNYNLAGFGKTTASLINLILLIVPLMGLTLGAISLAGEREKGTLLYLLAQPVSPFEVLLGKFLGIGAALLAALLIGFGLSGYLIALRGGMTQIGSYLSLIGFTLLLALATLGIGLLISSFMKKAESAVGMALFLWLFFVFFGDLGLIGSTLFFKLDIQQVLYISLINPLQAFKLGALMSMRANLEVLGPVGLYAMRTFGAQLAILISAVLGVWIFSSFVVTYAVIQKKGGL